MNELKLEFLRHGTNHNQLLSPLLPYLALCENEPVTSVQQPYTHAEMARNLTSLSYRYDSEERKSTVESVSRKLGELLGSVAGVCAKIGSDAAPQRLHFRLVLSAAELALLPFELSAVPSAVSSVHQHLLLSQTTDIAFTRETRRRATRPYEPSEAPKILFAFAQPTAPVPASEHGRVLRNALLPWLSGSKNAEETKKHLRVLPNASIDQLISICREVDFTHIHILAHGAELPDQMEKRFGLAFHGREGSDSIDVVDGARLASAVLSCKNKHSLQVVTLASCQSGYQGGVIGVGGSIAQELHHQGVPMVVGSQFPLSVIGSVELSKVLYEGLLWGEDPRWLVSCLRQLLHAKFPQTHDWGSLVHYLSMAPDIEKKILDARVKRAMNSVNCAKDDADAALKKTAKQELGTEEAKAIVQRILDARSKLTSIQLNSADSEAKSRLSRRMASTDQLLAELQFHVGADTETSRKKAREYLEEARKRYWLAYQDNPLKHWALLLYLTMETVFSTIDAKPMVPMHGTQSLPGLLNRVRLLMEIDISRGGIDRAWAYADRIEVAMIESLLRIETAEASAVEAAKQLKALMGQYPFPGFSALRQCNRYRRLYPQLAAENSKGQAAFEPALKIVAAIADVLPEIDRPEYRGY